MSKHQRYCPSHTRGKDGKSHQETPKEALGETEHPVVILKKYSQENKNMELSLNLTKSSRDPTVHYTWPVKTRMLSS